MKFKCILEKKREIGGLGVVEPGQVFDVENKNMMGIFIKGPFEEIKKEQPKKQFKKVKKEG